MTTMLIHCLQTIKFVGNVNILTVSGPRQNWTLAIFLHVKSFWLFEAPYFMQLDNTHYTNFPVTTVNMTFDFIDNIYILENISLTNGCHELYQTDYRVNYTEGNNANIIIDGGCSLQKKLNIASRNIHCQFLIILSPQEPKDYVYNNITDSNFTSIVPFIYVKPLYMYDAIHLSYIRPVHLYIYRQYNMYIYVIGIIGILFFVIGIWGCVKNKKSVDSYDYRIVNGLRCVRYTSYKKGIPKDCGICLNNYKFFDKLRILDCDHYYHHKCIIEWIDNYENYNCPICLTKINSDTDRYYSLNTSEPYDYGSLNETGQVKVSFYLMENEESC